MFSCLKTLLLIVGLALTCGKEEFLAKEGWVGVRIRSDKALFLMGQKADIQLIRSAAGQATLYGNLDIQGSFTVMGKPPTGGTDKTYVDAQIKGVKESMTDKLAQKADKTYVDAQIKALKDIVLAQADTIKKMMKQLEDLEEGAGQLPACLRSSRMAQCKQLKEAGCKISGVYKMSTGLTVYCDMFTAGGGWQLLVTQLHAKTQYSGSYSPFVKDLNPNKPDPTQAYSRNWKALGLSPKVADEFLLTSTADADYVRFVNSQFCAWDGTKCGTGSSHLQIANGQTYNSKGAALDGYVYFNGCAQQGGCASTGTDGIGFGKNAGYTYAVPGCYGGCWTGGNGAFHWGSTKIVPGVMAYYWRPK